MPEKRLDRFFIQRINPRRLETGQDSPISVRGRATRHYKTTFIKSPARILHEVGKRFALLLRGRLVQPVEHGEGGTSLELTAKERLGQSPPEGIARRRQEVRQPGRRMIVERPFIAGTAGCDVRRQFGDSNENGKRLPIQPQFLFGAGTVVAKPRPTKNVRDALQKRRFARPGVSYYHYAPMLEHLV